MKLLKPMALSVLTGPYERKGRVHLAIVVAVMVSFDGTVLENEQTLWKTLPDVPGFSGILDELKPKIKSEVLAMGWAFAPEGRKVPARSVKIQVGSWSKELWVVGDRVWRSGVATEPIAFDRMPLSWERAFGGEGYALNPIGRGLAPVKTDTGQVVHPLPNIELPKKLVGAPGDRPPPAGFGAIDPGWPRRMSKAGTYDKHWLETRFPDYPDDFDPTYFNTAPEDQWLDKPLEGGEQIVVERMHPTKESIETTVPRFVVRAFVSRETDLLRDVAMKLDTIILVPHIERFVMLYRAYVEVKDDEASDVSDLLVALERPNEPKGMSHYRAIREKRLDREKGGLYALRDGDLLPPNIRVGAAASEEDYAALLAREGLVERATKNRARAELERAREEMREAGLDPDKHLPQDIPKEENKAPDMNNLAEFVETTEKQARDAVAEAEKHRERVMEDARQMCLDNGLDFDKLLADAKKKQGGPPKFSAKAEMERLLEMAQLSANAGIGIPEVARLADEDLAQKLLQTERVLKDTYRKHVHQMPRAYELDEEHSRRVRLEVEAMLINGESLAERDFTGANLSGLDFSGRDLSRSFMEAAHLEGCKFVGAKLEQTVLARAKLANAVFTTAKLMGANFGEADCANAQFDGGVDATEAVFYRTDLRGANLRGMLLIKADINEAKLAGADLSGVVASELTVLRSDFRGAKFDGAKITESNLLELDFSGVDFRRCTFDSTVLLDVTANGANFDDAKLETLRVVGVDRGSSLEGATFRRANLRKAFFRGARLQKADFSDALLDNADLSKCDLTHATFEGARMRETRLMKANLKGANLDHTDLFQALMGGANLRGAHFEEASLFRADAMGAVGDDKTSFRGANVNFVRKAARSNG